MIGSKYLQSADAVVVKREALPRPTQKMNE